MRFEIIGWRRTKFLKVMPQSKKNGQKELHPAVKIRAMSTLPNTVLEQFDPLMRAFLYEKNGQGAKEQKQLDGVEVITDLPQLRQAGAKIKALPWDDEQTGTTVIVDHGMGGASNLKLKDCTLSNFKLVPKDGGTTQVYYDIFSTDVDRDTLGELGVLHQHEVKIEVIPPKVVQEKIPEGDAKAGKGKKGEALTPQQALERSVKQKQAEGAPA